MASDKGVKRTGKRGRKPSKIDTKTKLERSRQSARECRARKKLRYQYLEELVSSREHAIHSLRAELEMYKQWSKEIDAGRIPEKVYTAVLQKSPEVKKEPNVTATSDSSTLDHDAT